MRYKTVQWLHPEQFDFIEKVIFPKTEDDIREKYENEIVFENGSYAIMSYIPPANFADCGTGWIEITLYSRTGEFLCYSEPITDIEPEYIIDEYWLEYAGDEYIIRLDVQ